MIGLARYTQRPMKRTGKSMFSKDGLPVSASDRLFRLSKKPELSLFSVFNKAQEALNYTLFRPNMDNQHAFE